MRQLAPGRLGVSPGLQAADSAAIARWASAARSGGAVLGAAAARLQALCAGMPVGVWRSTAAGVFVHAGLEEVRRLHVVAGLFERLAAVGAQLASALAAAQEQARLAARRGEQVDLDVQAFNDRLRAQHALRPQDPDSLLADAPEADDLQMRLATAAGDLADAEAAAQRAWQQAAAAFDLISYATPAMRQRLAGTAWDPAAEVRLASSAAAGVSSCGPMEELGLPANGILIGPDGRSYPLAVQAAAGEGGELFVPARTPVQDEGWSTLAVRIGTTAYGRKAETWEKVAVALGGAAGASYPQGSTFAPGLLDDLHIMADGGAFLPSPTTAPIDAVKEAPAAAPHDYLQEYWIAPTTGIAAGWVSVAGEAVSMIGNVLGGLATASHLDDGRAADYRVVFEENAQGSLRARLELYRVLDVPGEQPRVLTDSGYVNSSGKLAGVRASGDAPGVQPLMAPAQG